MSGYNKDLGYVIVKSSDKTGLTEVAAHNYCNAVMWQYHKR